MTSIIANKTTDRVITPLIKKVAFEQDKGADFTKQVTGISN